MGYKFSLKDWSNLVPADCPGCNVRTSNHKLCPKCSLSLAQMKQRPCCLVCAQILIEESCPSCNKTEISFDKAIAAFYYQDLGKKFIRDFKISNRLALADFLANLLMDEIKIKNQIDMPDLIVPVPSHWGALRTRGFSPPAEIARLLAKKLKITYKLDLLARAQETAKQTTLGFRQRQIAPQQAFVSNSNSLTGMHIAVVDDVMTTGATLNAVAKILKQSGAHKVQAWVLARTLP